MPVYYEKETFFKRACWLCIVPIIWPWLVVQELIRIRKYCSLIWYAHVEYSHPSEVKRAREEMYTINRDWI